MTDAIFTSIKENIASLAFTDRKLGFFEDGEAVEVKLTLAENTEENEKYVIMLSDPYGKAVSEYSFEVEKGSNSANISFGVHSIGWYRVRLCSALDSERRELNEYLAFAVLEKLEHRTTVDGAIGSDVAVEYEPRVIAVYEELVRSLKLQGFDFIRSRIVQSHSRELTAAYRALLKRSGIRQTVHTTAHMYDMPKVRDIDFRNIYNYYKNVDGLDISRSDIYEIQNESDLFYDHPPLPDTLTAYSKAAAIGMSDSGTDSVISMTSTAYSNDSFYYDCQLQNGILDYSCIYNFHGYGDVTRIAKYAVKSTLAYSPEDDIRPAMMTENGYKVWADEKGICYADQLLEMCRYALKNSAKMLEAGTDKWFWFITRAFLESGGGFGNCHAWTNQPYPIVATLSALTYHLGEGRYIGKPVGIPEKAYGYMFDNGKSDVAILFAAEDKTATFNEKSVTVSDMFGRLRTQNADADGVVRVNVGQDPIIVIFNGRVDESKYYRSSLSVKKYKKLYFDRAQRVVLNPIWDDQNLSDGTVMRKGYILDKESLTQHIKFRIYNFNDTAVSGKIYVTPEYDEHFEIALGKEDFTVEPFGRIEKEIVLKASDTIPPDSSADILFGAELDNGEKVTSAVSRYWLRSEETEIDSADIKKFTGYTDLENWNLKNICVPGSMSASVDKEKDSITLHAEHGNGYVQWYFPEFFVQNPEIFEGSSGIVFKRKHSENAKCNVTVFACTRDGRAYYSGVNSGIKMTTDEKTAAYPWDVFVLYSSPEGFNDPRGFDPKDIYMLRIGVSGVPKGNIPDTEIWDLGVFKDRRKYTSPHPHRIEISGIEAGAVYKSAKGLKLTALLPETVIDDVRLFNGKTPYEFTLDSGRLSADLSSLGRGEYIFHVSGRTKTNYRYSNNISFVIEE